MVVLAVIRVTARGSEVFRVTESASGDADFKSFNFGGERVRDAFVDALVKAVDRDASFGVAGCCLRYLGYIVGFGCGRSEGFTSGGRVSVGGHG